MTAVPTINTQPVSDAHDKIFTNVLKGLSDAREFVLGLSNSFTTRTSSVRGLSSLPKADPYINDGFDLVEKVLTKQHDVTESLLARTR
jgi:hypothetical protein